MGKELRMIANMGARRLHTLLSSYVQSRPKKDEFISSVNLAKYREITTYDRFQSMYGFAYIRLYAYV